MDRPIWYAQPKKKSLPKSTRHPAGRPSYINLLPDGGHGSKWVCAAAADGSPPFVPWGPPSLRAHDADVSRCRQSTVTSRSVPPYMENGRLYHGYKKGMYMFPCDEVSAPGFVFSPLPQ